ncbi:MAG: hypothetical protein U9R66_03300 [Thermodesulfobacteriota bacterium]|nr:hypothetical protein [Thermodesulfobacteriota bacterium]
MDQTFATESLLPWLDPESSKVHLNISLRSTFSDIRDKSSFPFMLLDESSPLAHLVHASFATGSDKVIKEIFLLVQKDRYSFIDRNIPFDNWAIDGLWQEVSKLEAAGSEFASFFTLSDGKNIFPLWRSLFYCKNHSCFFHPPCPQCGSFLELCCEDEILTAANLPPYSSTLERFLYCPLCHNSQSSDFFTCDESDAVRHGIKDCQALVDGFTQLLGNDSLVSGFPCPGCKDRRICFETEKLASSRITSFAFYPFRMMPAEAGQLQGQDFLSLISGASCREMKSAMGAAGEPGRVACIDAFRERGTDRLSFFFDDEERNFLEILYLKIAFLAQISRASLSALKHLQHADLRLTIDQFWVNVSDYDGLLPFYWNFTVKPLALGIAPPAKTSFVRLPEALGLYSLGILWFNSLLVNRAQSASDVNHALALLIEENSLENEPDFFALFSKDEFRVFGPENIFRHPDEKKISPIRPDLWQKALNLGWFLLCSSFHAKAGFSSSSFQQEIADLAAEVKNSLFAAPQEEAAPTVKPAVMKEEQEREEDVAIRKILVHIQEKWQADARFVEEEVESVEEKTVTGGKEMEEDPPEEDLEKTVILSAEQLTSMMEKEDLPATPSVTLETERDEPSAEALERPTETITEDEVELEKTVIMNLNEISSALSEQQVVPGPPVESSTDPAAEKIEETEEAKATDFAEDELSETVMIDPEQLKKLRKVKNGK